MLDLFIGEIIIVAGLILLCVGVAHIIKTFARYSRWIQP